MAKCPGQDQRFWKPKDIFEINCPDCSTPIEFWKDDPQVKCPGCKKMITNPRLDISCAKWCKYAKECVGGKVYEQYLKTKGKGKGHAKKKST